MINVVAVLSLMDVPDPALMAHVFWGSLLLALMLWGPGRWSLDRFMIPKLRVRVCGEQRPHAVVGERPRR